MSCVRFLSENFADTEILANYEVSSQQSSFPILNAFNKNRRSKVWRSNGYYNIVSGSNTIIFNEGASNLTAIIAVGEYTSTSAFMTAIDNAFTNAVGATGSYTVTQNSELKFVITKTTGIFNILWTNPSSVVMANILGFDTATDSTGALTYTADVFKIHGNTGEFILFDMGASANPDSLVITGPRNRALKLSPSGVFKLEGNETNNFTSPSFSQTLEHDDESIFLINTDGLHTEALRFWRLTFFDQNPIGYIEVGAFFLGTSYAPSRGRVQFPFEGSYVDRTVEVFSEGGQSFSDIFEQTERINLNWFGLTKEDREEIDRIFKIYGKGKPFFMTFDTNEAFSTSKNKMVRFVKFESEPNYRLVSPNNFQINMTLLEQL